MDVARYTSDNFVYTAYDFAQLPPTELAQKRRCLICNQCDGPAFFRKAARSGQPACFGARPHAPGCTLASPESDRQKSQFSGERESWENSGAVIVVDFALGSDNRTNVDTSDISPPPDVRKRPARYSASGPRLNTNETSKRLSRLLYNLTESESFQHSEQLLQIPGKGNFPVHNFFKNFHSISDRDINKYGGYWGLVTDARLDNNGSLWLNSGWPFGEFAAVSVLIDVQFVDIAFQRYRINDEEDLAGAYLLVFGTLVLSKNRKPYILVEDLSQFALFLAPP
ncbi:hypothetical protein [Anthocerotibacter panamensis]|uniref:hypothetical protein n=1 Tax=Anthocerotibacter panamensis TaxID=2857077 RepID=UPI001C408B84|nr:hypothetical protein [Anthocerotibacter panamensis]